MVFTHEEFIKRMQGSVEVLSNLASFLRKPYFNRIAKLSTRFDTTVTAPIIQKQLDSTKKYQLSHCMSFETKTSTYAELQYNEIDTQVLLNCVADEIDAFVDNALNKMSKLKRPTKKQSAFVVPKGLSPLEYYMAVFPCRMIDDVRFFLASIENNHRLDSFNINQALYGVSTFIEMMDTLVNETPFKTYEQSLKALMKKPDFFINGYPFDILVHDKHTLMDALTNKKMELIAIYTHPNRASSVSVFKNQKSYDLDEKTLKIA
jgi:hypothetical protein